VSIPEKNSIVRGGRLYPSEETSPDLPKKEKSHPKRREKRAPQKKKKKNTKHTSELNKGEGSARATNRREKEEEGV